MRRLVFFLALVALAGCGAHYPSHGSTGANGGDTGGSSGSTLGDAGCGDVSWNRQVQPIVNAYCLRCHGDPAQFGAPYPLTTYARTQTMSVSDPRKPVYEVMAEFLSNRLMPPSGARPSAEQIDLVQQWAAAGGPEDACPGSDAGYVDAGAPADAGTIDLTGATFKSSAGGYVVAADAGRENNLYRCFPFTVGTEDGGPRTITQFAPVVDNSTILHHMILYRIPGGDSPTTPYDCFGGPQTASSDPQFMYGWAPGAQAFTFPQDVGLPIKHGDQFVLQIHYHNFTGTPQTDSSGVALWWTDQPVAHQASVVMLGVAPFSLPPGDPDAQVTGYCHVPTGAVPDVQVFAAMPHMHLRGTLIDTVRELADGGSEPLVSVPNWSFDDQHARDAGMVIHPGDVLRTDCHYNTLGDQSTVFYGENTENEMCFDFLFAYPIGVNVQLPGSCLN